MSQAFGLQSKIMTLYPGRWPWAGMSDAFGVLKEPPIQKDSNTLPAKAGTPNMMLSFARERRRILRRA
jgi:hypothetical protein